MRHSVSKKEEENEIVSLDEMFEGDNQCLKIFLKELINLKILILKIC